MTKLANYETHLKQYAECRARVQQCEADLKFGDRTCLLYRDFVNTYSEAGSKIKNLVLVKITRGADGQLVVEKRHNLCSSKQAGCDAFFVADVMDFHMKAVTDGGSGFLEHEDHIIQSGDHGPHFACCETVWNESQFFDKYGKTLSNLFLCSYHAYNRCDGAGVCLKKAAEAASRDQCGPIDAEDYVNLMNSAHHFDTTAHTFSSINRGVDIFPKKLKKMSGVKKFCEVLFTHGDQNGSIGAHTVGVARARLVPGSGPFTVFDLVPRAKAWGPLCRVCSSAQQRAVYHKREGSKCAPTAKAIIQIDKDMKARTNVPHPDPGRISGPQVGRKRKGTEVSTDQKKIHLGVDAMRTELLRLGVDGSALNGLKKPALQDLLANTRATAGKTLNQPAAKRVRKSIGDMTDEGELPGPNQSHHLFPKFQANEEFVSCAAGAAGAQGDDGRRDNALEDRWNETQSAGVLAGDLCCFCLGPTVGEDMACDHGKPHKTNNCPIVFHKKCYKHHWQQKRPTWKKCICRHCAACGGTLTKNVVDSCRKCRAEFHLECAHALNFYCMVCHHAIWPKQ